MQISPVIRIIELPLTIGADRDIRRNENLALFFFAFYDRKFCILADVFRRVLTIQFQDHGTLWRVVQQILDKRIDLFLFPLRVNLDIRSFIADAPANPVGC